MIREDADNLDEIKDKIKTLLWEAEDIIDEYRGHGSPDICARAKSYWFAHIQTALDSDHDYIGGSMCSMAETIEEIEQYHDDNPEDSDE